MDDRKDPLEVLSVVDRLEVGPVSVERDRIRAPYTVAAGGTTESTELTYRFPEPVFAPDEYASKNLASMVAAQVALNFGLSCRRMVFKGVYDENDHKFLVRMARHTAREIYVNKFLRPNPFVRGAARHLKPVKRDHYLRATIRFEPEEGKRFGASPGRWGHAGGGKYLVLASGGKDSLLTYGLLNELGFETHPVFVNEAGRHWYTALNAHRYFAQNVPLAARVWTNADRVFAWMLRRLAFVREDFERVRSDQYPVRLWTVAVFLFGALPLALSRGIGRVVIGDEYDTTVRASHAGITHYAGYYDQSRYFDQALSRYFARKGWSLSQFSIIRPLSEFLVQKILAERYPEVQRLQVSCHAAHLDGDRALPCGKCEKCRRVVGMLIAAGADPTRCGYSAEQISGALSSLTRNKVHQETAGAEHMMHLLTQRRPDFAKGTARETWAIRPRPHPEVMKLRFDRERSPADAMPVELREALSHPLGAFRRRRQAQRPGLGEV